MPFAPREIEEKEFLVSLRGYNREEVRAFLRAAAADYRAALERTEDGDTRGDVEAYTRARGAVRATDRLGERSTFEREQAEAELAEMRRKAERDARRIVEDAQREASEVRTAVDRHTSEQLAKVARKVEDLRLLEERMARRLYFIETALELARHDLTTDGTDRAQDSSELPVSARRYLSPSPADEG